MKEITLTSLNFENEVLNSSVPVLVDFWATWCGPCRMLAPTIEQLAEESDGSYKVGKINIDDELNLAIKYKVEVIPTLMLFKDGQVVEKSVGVLEKDQIKAKFNL